MGSVDREGVRGDGGVDRSRRIVCTSGIASLIDLSVVQCARTVRS